MPSEGAKLTVILSGPFFTKDPRVTFRQNVRTMLEALAAEGEADVRRQFPVVTGEGREGVVGRVASLAGKPWMLHAVVSQQHVYPWGKRGTRGATFRASGDRSAEDSGKAAQYRGGKTEAKYHMFRRTAGRIRSSRAVILADLAEGLN